MLKIIKYSEIIIVLEIYVFGFYCNFFLMNLYLYDSIYMLKYLLNIYKKYFKFVINDIIFIGIGKILVIYKY